MSRWLSRDVLTMPLGAIEAEISSIEKMSVRDRSVATVQRLLDLRATQQRITGRNERGCCF